MKRVLTALTIAIVAFATISYAAAAAEGPARDELGRSVKFRILVDKTMQPEAKWTTEEWMIEEAAEAGFNVYSPRRGHADLDAVRQVTKWCEKYGIYHIPWMRGTRKAPDGEKADGKRMVWASGATSPIWSPNSDEFWEWTHKYIIEYAKMSADNEHLIGVFLDYENYVNGPNAYQLSYDDVIMNKFAKAEGIELPELAFDERKSWLQKQELHDRFREFQIDHWRQRCRTLRKAVDQHNPNFQFCIYPAPGTMFMQQACYPEWATEQAPLILADACTYGRSSRFLPEAEAVKRNRKQLKKRIQVPQEADIPFVYVGGIDPVVEGADPEFCGKNAVLISDITDGYWVFYEGPEYDKDHPKYFKWFTWANDAIKADNFEAQYAPRKTSENFGLALTGGEDVGKLIPPEVTGETFEFPTVNLRRDNMVLISATADQKVQIEVQNKPLADYKSMLVWNARGPSMAEVASGKVPHGEKGTITFTAPKDGIYVIGMSSGSCMYSILKSNVPVGLYTGEGLGLIRGAERLYFHVPEGLESFAITNRGRSSELARINLYNPDGAQVATAESTIANTTARIEAQAGEHDDGVWALEITKPKEGYFEDNSTKLSKKLPPVLSFKKDHVFRLEPVE